jgi:hypothetical protein
VESILTYFISRVQGVRYGSGRLYLQWRALPRAEDDGSYLYSSLPHVQYLHSVQVGNNLKDQQLQQIVDKTIMEADRDGDGKLSFEEFALMVSNTDIVKQMTLEDLF